MKSKCIKKIILFLSLMSLSIVNVNAALSCDYVITQKELTPSDCLDFSIPVYQCKTISKGYTHATVTSDTSFIEISNYCNGKTKYYSYDITGKNLKQYQASNCDPDQTKERLVFNYKYLKYKEKATKETTYSNTPQSCFWLADSVCSSEGTISSGTYKGCNCKSTGTTKPCDFNPSYTCTIYGIDKSNPGYYTERLPDGTKDVCSNSSYVIVGGNCYEPITEEKTLGLNDDYSFGSYFNAKDSADKIKQGLEKICEASSTNMRGGIKSIINCEILNYKFILDYYYKTCDKIEITYTNKFCNSSFEIKGNPAYCVNPGVLLATVNDDGKNYQRSSFDASKCANSNSSVDCGYANIMIEASRRNELAKKYPSQYEGGYTDGIIELALRLWGAHVGASGYDKLGMATADVIGGKITPIYVYPGVNGYSDSWKNIYKTSLNKLYKNLNNTSESRYLNTTISKLATIDTYNPLTSTMFKKITCDSINNASVMCTKSDATNKDYLKAIALYIDTLQGNADMQERIVELYNLKNNTDVSLNGETTDVQIIQNEKNLDERTLINTYSEYIIEGYKEKINCSNEGIEEFKTKYKKVTGKTATTKEINEINNHCNTSVKIVYKLNGQNKEQEIDNFDYCQKNKCYVELEKLAICTWGNVINYEVYLKEKKATFNTVVSKYIPCASTTDTQTMWSMNINKLHNNPDEEVETKKTGFVNCYSTCTGTDAEVLKESGKCKEYNKTTNASVKDPSMNCILNLSSDKKKEYDYSDYFKVDKSICRIYCRDEVTYTLPQRSLVSNGTKLMFDIDAGTFGSTPTKNKPAYTAKITAKRECVSKINYRHFDDYEILQKEYGLTDNEIALIQNNGNKYNELEILIKVLLKKSKNEGGRTEVLNRLFYNIYNCNMYNSNEIIAKNATDSNKLTNRVDRYSKPNNVNNLNETINSIYAKSNYDDNNINASFSFDTGGAVNISTKKNIKDIDLKSEFIGSTSTSSSIIGDILYCSEGEDCLKYNKNSDSEKKHNTTKNGFASRKLNIEDEHRSYNSIVSSISGTLQSVINNIGKMTQNYTDSDGKKKELVIDNITLGTSYARYDVKLPKYDYVLFTVDLQYGIYNDKEYVAEPFSGRIKEKSGNTEANYIDVGKYVYPLSPNQYNLCGGNSTTVVPNNVCDGSPISSSDYNASTKSCGIGYTFDGIRIFDRINVNDDFSYALNDIKTFKCSFDVLPQLGSPKDECCRDDCPADEITFRNVDIESIDNIFPPGVEIAENWLIDDPKNISSRSDYSGNMEDYLNSNAKALKDRIEDGSNMMDYFSKNLDYQYTLTPDIISKIKNHPETFTYLSIDYDCNDADSTKCNDMHSCTKEYVCVKHVINSAGKSVVDCKKAGKYDLTSKNVGDSVKIDNYIIVKEEKFTNCKSRFLDELDKLDSHGKSIRDATRDKYSN